MLALYTLLLYTLLLTLRPAPLYGAPARACGIPPPGLAPRPRT